jgi:hypothetical protein
MKRLIHEVDTASELAAHDLRRATATTPPKHPVPKGRPDPAPTPRPPTFTVLLACTARCAAFAGGQNEG